MNELSVGLQGNKRFAVSFQAFLSYFPAKIYLVSHKYGFFFSCCCCLRSLTAGYSSEGNTFQKNYSRKLLAALNVGSASIKV